MKTRYKIIIIILLIIGIIVSPIMMIDYVYANTNTPQFTVVSKVFCPYFPIPDDFVANQIFFAMYSTNPIIQLNMIHYDFYSVCYDETNDTPIDLDPEDDPLNSKGCPQFCPKETSFKKHPSYTKEEIEIMKSNGWKVYPGGIGWAKPNTPMITSIYVKNPNNPDELVLDIDAILQLKEVLEHCQSQKDGLGTDAIFFSYSNDTHYIDNDICEWSKRK